ncbi:hypothetical protein DFJ43DRAFT_1071889 [Lentinula guzmanii]|uniref:Uncharacterized protein n=1 Tax=Lentinula guzmanii TaxID=2804957 RepID=A0AA38JM12_9AGAR|nr:hypothetical protein DFJ43DRAFT_1071889 [Lentinula guzmanii]
MSFIETEVERIIQPKSENGGSGEDENEIKIEIENGSEDGDEDGDEDPYKLARLHASQLSVLSQNYTPVVWISSNYMSDLMLMNLVRRTMIYPLARRTSLLNSKLNPRPWNRKLRKSHQLESKLPPPKVESGIYMADICLTFVQHIAGCCDFGFIDILPPATEEYDMILTLYDNHTIWSRELVDAEEDDVVSIMRREMPVLNDRELRWFYPLFD